MTMTKWYNSNSKSDSDRSDKNDKCLKFAQKVAIEVKSRVVAIHGRRASLSQQSWTRMGS